MTGAVRLLGIWLFCSISTAALAQDELVESYLAYAEERATTFADTAAENGRGAAMDAAQATLNAIASFRASYAGSLQLSAGALAGQSAILYENIHAAVDTLADSQNIPLDRLQRINGTLTSAIINIPLPNDIPRVSNVAPLYTVDTGLMRDLVINGVGLANGQPILQMNGIDVRPAAVSDTELRFQLPPVESPSRAVVLASILTLFERKEQFLLLSSYDAKIYPVRLASYPKEMGLVTVTPRRRIVERHQIATPLFRCESPHGEGAASAPATVVATPGWLIDPSTIKYNRSHSNHGSFTMTTISGTGFSAMLSCHGWGRNFVDRGSMGVEEGYFIYTELRDATTLQDGQATNEMLRWGDTIKISNLPPDTETIVVEISPFTGERQAVEGVGANRFLRVEFDSVGKIVTVTGHKFDEVLRQ